MFSQQRICLSPAFKTFLRNVAMKGDVHLSGRREMRKIKLGRARPAIFHQFDTLVELSDGSVIKRRSQAPKDELRMISDSRNSTLWNPNRSDLVTVDPNATGKVNKFKQRYSSFDQDESADDSLVDLMAKDAKEVQKGGKLYNKKESKK